MEIQHFGTYFFYFLFFSPLCHCPRMQASLWAQWVTPVGDTPSEARSHHLATGSVVAALGGRRLSSPAWPGGCGLAFISTPPFLQPRHVFLTCKRVIEQTWTAGGRIWLSPCTCCFLGFCLSQTVFLAVSRCLIFTWGFWNDIYVA